MSTSAIRRRVRAGRLFRKHQGVYAVGRPDLSQGGVFHAAVLAIGDDAVLSHRSAAVLHDFWKSAVSVVEVTVPRRCRSRRGIRVHCVDRPPPTMRLADSRDRAESAASGCGRLANEIAGGPKPTRSRLETGVLRFIREGDYPPFETNARKQAIVEAAGIRVLRLRWEDLAPATRPLTHARVGHALHRRPAA